MQRLDSKSGVGTLAAARWASEDYDIENIKEWGPMEDGIYTVGKFTPAYFSTSGEGKACSWLLEGHDLTESEVEVHYDPDEVHMTMQGEGEGIRGGTLVALDPEQAKEIGAALYQAGEELERWREVKDADD